jgi:hypothetical protein
MAVAKNFSFCPPLGPSLKISIFRVLSHVKNFFPKKVLQLVINPCKLKPKPKPKPKLNPSQLSKLLVLLSDWTGPLSLSPSLTQAN